MLQGRQNFTLKEGGGQLVQESRNGEKRAGTESPRALQTTLKDLNLTLRAVGSIFIVT